MHSRTCDTIWEFGLLRQVYIEASGLCYDGGLRQLTDVIHADTEWLRSKRSINVQHTANRLAGAIMGVQGFRIQMPEDVLRAKAL